MLAVLASILCQAEPTIDAAELLTGGAYRPGHWAPLEIRITTPGAFDGEAAVRTDIGFTMIAPVRTGGAGAVRVIVPVLPLSVSASLEITLRAGGRSYPPFKRRDLGRALWESDLLVGVDPALGKLEHEKVLAFPFDARDPWRDEVLEAVDLIVGKPPPFPTWRGEIAGTIEEAKSRLAAFGKHRPALIEPIDAPAYELRRRGAWIESKRSGAVLFAALYAAAGVVLLALLLRLRPRRWAAPSAVAGMALLGTIGYLAFFPRGTVSVVRQSCRLDGISVDLDFVRRSTPGTVTVDFPRLVKPVFTSYQEASTSAFEIRMTGGGCRVILDLKDDRAFGSVAPSPGPAVRVTPEGFSPDVPIFGSGIMILDQHRALGDRRAGNGFTVGDGTATAPPLDPVFQYFHGRFGTGDVLYGWLGTREGPARTVSSPDLAEERARPEFFIQRLP